MRSRDDLERLLKLEHIDDALLCSGEERVIWDKAVPGLGLRLRSNAKPVWIVQRRIEGRTIKRTLGGLAIMSLTDARTAARKPIEPETRKPPTVPTLVDFVPVFLRDCAGRWKASTFQHHRSNLLIHVVPSLGTRPIDALSRADVIGWLDDGARSTASGNRALSVLSLVMQHAELLGLRPEGSNPCAGLAVKRDQFEARYLTDDEMFRLVSALSRLFDRWPVEIAALRFLILTGARRGEALGLEWSFIEGPRAVLPDSKTGSKTIWLAEPVRRLLAGLRRHRGSAFVFTRDNGKAVSKSGLVSVWKRARTLAALDGVRLHDLRHSFASVAVCTGEELRTVASLLGHADLATTMGYAHLAEAPIAEAAGRVAKQIEGALVPKEPVVPIKLPAPRPKKTKRPRQPRAPKPTLPPEPPLPERDRPWVRPIEAFHKSPLRLDAFCADQGLDPKQMGQALARHFERRKELAGRAG
ncbi:MAG: site-specific integrase [Alphaproteobacteria bacterium]|nr:site-specific integrase [Alphaproteobacteria bacterium]